MLTKGRGQSEVAPAILPFDADRPAVEAARRDARAFEPLYRKDVAQICSFAHNPTPDRHGAEDVTEPVFVSAPVALRGFRGRRPGQAPGIR